MFSVMKRRFIKGIRGRRVVRQGELTEKGQENPALFEFCD